jgi:hypothetical protein
MIIKTFENFKNELFEEITFNEFMDRRAKTFYPDWYISKYEIKQLEEISKKLNIEIRGYEKKQIKENNQLKVVSVGLNIKFYDLTIECLKTTDEWWVIRIVNAGLKGINLIYYKCDNLDGLDELIKYLISSIKKD